MSTAVNVTEVLHKRLFVPPSCVIMLQARHIFSYSWGQNALPERTFIGWGHQLFTSLKLNLS